MQDESQQTQGDSPEPRNTTVAFKVTETEQRAIAFLALVHDKSVSETIRDWLDMPERVAEAERRRALSANAA